jgi:type II secretion system protein C
MKKIIIGSFIAFSFALLVASIIGYFITVPKDINLRDVKIVKIDDKLSKTINIADKVVVAKTVNSTNYLNAWKLSATIIGKTSMAMVLKGRDSKILKLKDSLEGYEVKKIEKDKVLFSTATDDVWLYIKTDKVQLNNPVLAVVPTVGTYNIREASFKRYLLTPERLLKTINIMPEVIEGKFRGMKVVSLLEGSFLYSNGLRQGDIIQKINGKKLLSIADGISAYQNISTSSKFTISVLRDNKIEEFKYEIVK